MPIQSRNACFCAGSRVQLKNKKLPLAPVVFYVNTFAWLEGVSKVLPPLIIVEGLVLDYNLYFDIVFREYLQTCEGTHNNLTLHTIGTLALGPSRNMQDGIRCYSLAIC